MRVNSEIVNVGPRATVSALYRSIVNPFVTVHPVLDDHRSSSLLEWVVTGEQSVRFILPNFSFEEALAGGTPGSSPSLHRTVDALAAFLGLMAEPGDCVVVSDQGVPTQLSAPLSHVSYITFRELLQHVREIQVEPAIVPWGWDPPTRQLAAQLGISRSLPSAESVLFVNSRKFSAVFDTVDDTTGICLFDERFGLVCATVEEFRSGVAHLLDQGFTGWVAKSALSTSGRNRILGRLQLTNANQLGWLQKRLQRDGYVYLEPWTRPIRECGIQLTVPRSGSGSSDIEVIGVTELITDHTGRYRGSVVCDEVDPMWQLAVEHAVRAGREAARVGYFGPMGVDCMQFVLPDGRQVTRMCNDINGRLTMGRLALQLQKGLDRAHGAVWIHSAINDHQEDFGTSAVFPARVDSGVVETIKVSPGLIGGRAPAVDSWLYVTDGPQAARNLAQSVREQFEIEK